MANFPPDWMWVLSYSVTSPASIAGEHCEHERPGSSSRSLIPQLETRGPEDVMRYTGRSRLHVSNSRKLHFPLPRYCKHYHQERATWLHGLYWTIPNALILSANKCSIVYSPRCCPWHQKHQRV